MFLDDFEAVRMVLECCKGQSSVHARFFERCYIKGVSLLLENYLQLSVVVLRNALEDGLCISISVVNHRSRWQ